jgi:hypothetical protein
LQEAQLYKLEDKQKLQQYIDENKTSFKQMIFFGILDMSIFSRMFSMVELTMANYISPEDMPQDIDGEL